MRVERVRVDEVEDVAGPEVVATRPAEAAGNELDRQRAREPPGPFVLLRPAQQQHGATGQVRLTRGAVGHHRGRVTSEQPARDPRGALAQGAGLGRVARAADEQPALALAERGFHLLARKARPRESGGRGRARQAAARRSIR